MGRMGHADTQGGEAGGNSVTGLDLDLELVLAAGVKAHRLSTGNSIGVRRATPFASCGGNEGGQPTVTVPTPSLLPRVIQWQS